MDDEVDIDPWLDAWRVHPGMDVAAFVAAAEALDANARGALMWAVRSAEEPAVTTAVAALRVTGLDPVRRPDGRLMFATVLDPGPSEPLRRTWTYDQLVAPLSARPHRARAEERQELHLRDVVRGARKAGATWSEVRDRSRRRREATAALAEAATGRSAEEVDGLLDEVWATQGLPAPPLQVRPVLVERALDPPSKVEDARLAVDSTRDLARAAWRGVRYLRAHRSILPILPDGGAEPAEVLVTPGRSEVVEVTLDADAQARMPALSRAAALGIGSFAMTRVHVRRGADGAVEVWSRPNEDGQAGDRLGVVPAEHADAYLPSLETGEQRGIPVAVFAQAVAGRGRRWRLYVNLPKDDQD